MKTYKDFDVSVIRDVFNEQGKKNGMNPKEIEEMLEDMIENNGDTLEASFPCKKCGLKFRLNNLQHNCRREDIWLSEYVHSSKTKKSIRINQIMKLSKRYPLKKGNKLVFRGINFMNKEDFDKFMEESKGGYFDFKEISSWSADYSTASNYARCQQKGTSFSNNERIKEVTAMFNEGYNITGYKGIILALDIKSENVLCDISKEQIGGYHEHEVVLMPGNYNAVIIKTIEKEKKTWKPLSEKDWNKIVLGGKA